MIASSMELIRINTAIKGAQIFSEKKYIDKISKQNKFFKQNKDILKTLNTLAYVINHMENELSSKCIYYEKKDWDKFH